MRTMIHLAAISLLLAVAGCGADYVPPSYPVTGRTAQPLGQVMDVDVELPQVYVPEAGAAGLRLALRIEIQEAGFGIHRAHYEVEVATAAMGWILEVEDLGGGSTEVTVTPDNWTTGRIGPLSLGGALLEVMLDGAATAGGRRVDGDAWDSQTALAGSFSGWARHRFLVATTDLSAAGRMAEVSLVRETELRVRRNLTPVSPDPFLRRSGEGVFVINRLTYDNVQRLDARSDFATTWQATAGVGANPHDAALVAGGRVFISRYEPPFNDLLILDAEDGSTLGTVPLADLAENVDGTPRPDRMALVGDTLFVGLQDIDRTFTRFAPAKLAVIDPAQDRVAGVVPLGGLNPGAMEIMQQADGSLRLYVALAGIFPILQAQQLEGGVVVVDPVNRVVERVALDDDVAGGNIGGLAMVTPDLGYVIVSDEALVNRVLAFDPSTASVRRQVWATTQFIPEIEVDSSGVLAVPDTSFSNPGLCLYRVPGDGAAAETLLGCAALDLMPLSLEALD